MPQRMQDERRAAAISEEDTALELDVDPRETESDEEQSEEHEGGGDGVLPGPYFLGENPPEGGF